MTIKCPRCGKFASHSDRPCLSCRPVMKPHEQKLIKEKLQAIGQWTKIIGNFDLTPPEQARINSAFVLLKNLIADRMHVR